MMVRAPARPAASVGDGGDLVGNALDDVGLTPAYGPGSGVSPDLDGGEEEEQASVGIRTRAGTMPRKIPPMRVPPMELRSWHRSTIR